jgi:hypothetical protein
MRKGIYKEVEERAERGSAGYQGYELLVPTATDMHVRTNR